MMIEELRMLRLPGECKSDGHYFVQALSPMYVRCLRCRLQAHKVELGTQVPIHRA